jgi:hypothetical protein
LAGPGAGAARADRRPPGTPARSRVNVTFRSNLRGKSSVATLEVTQQQLLSMNLKNNLGRTKATN